MTPEPATDIPNLTPRLVPGLPAILPGATRVGPYSSARPGALLRVVPGVGRFLARDGSALEYCPDPGADADAIAALLGGGVLGALIHQRGELPLHATTVISPDRTQAVALTGRSGAGKSMTAYEFIRRGWCMLSDDLTRVTLVNDTPTAWPGRSELRLRADACEAFGIETANLAPAPGWPDKFVLELPRSDQPAALSAIVALDRCADALEVAAVHGASAGRVLCEQTYRIHYVAALGQGRRHLELVAAVTARTVVLQATGRAPVREVVAAVMRALLCRS